MKRSNKLKKGWIFLVLVLSLLIPSNYVSAGINVWTTTGPIGGHFKSLAASASTPGTIYAASDDSLFVSSNYGDSWRKLNSVNFRIFAFAMDPIDSDVLYIGSDYRLLKSIDGGATWSIIDPYPFYGVIRAIAIDPTNSGTLYLSTVEYPMYDYSHGHIYKSLDGGMHWMSQFFF